MKKMPMKQMPPKKMDKPMPSKGHAKELEKVMRECDGKMKGK